MNPDHRQTRPGSTLFIVLIMVFTAFLLSKIGAETRFSPTGKLFAQPRFWPAVGVFGMAGFGVLYLLTHWRQQLTGTVKEAMLWLRAIEYVVWFMAYVWIVPVIGYLPATLLFTITLSIRQGYRSRKQILCAAAIGIGIVLIFKTGLSVKIPGGALYEFLPPALRNFMIVNF